LEPIAYGFLVMIAGAAFAGMVVGAIGGAVVWRVSCHLLLGIVLTFCTFFLIIIADEQGHHAFLRAKLVWGAPSMGLTFLVGSIAARWLGAWTAIRRTWIALAAFGLALVAGFLYMLLFRARTESALATALWVDAGLVVLLILTRRLARRPESASER
jgi:hypothetical protein